MEIESLHRQAPALVGYIPEFLTELDPRKAREQFEEAYAHGGGWNPMKGWIMNRDTHTIRYPGDDRLAPVMRIHFREEIICIYAHAWVAIIQADGEFEIARMD